MELKITSDGSHTIYLETLNETYHSIHGAIQEAKHVFINAGLKQCLNLNKITVLEIGFGTGLNAMLTLLFSENLSNNIIYHSVEKYPLPEKIIEQLNYATQLALTPTQQKLIATLYTSSWDKPYAVLPNVELLKLATSVEAFFPTATYNLIYFDAFAPEKQPEMWEESVFIKLFNLLENNGILVTYCAKGTVKRTLRKVGFVVETISGPPGKREMIRAIKKTIPHIS